MSNVAAEILTATVSRNTRDAAFLAGRITTQLATMNVNDRSDLRAIQRDFADWVSAVDQVVSATEMLEDIDSVTKEGA